MTTPKNCIDCHRLARIKGTLFCAHMDLAQCPYGSHIPVPLEERTRKEKPIPKFDPSNLPKKTVSIWESIHHELFTDYFNRMTYKQMGDKYQINPYQIGNYIRRYRNEIER